MGFRYSSPYTQVVLVAFICFCCPGMFNAINGLGAAGQADATAQDNAGTALAVTFTIFSLIGGAVYNIIGHYVIIPAAFTYVLYIGSYLTPNTGFTVFTGALLGVGAGFLWTAQGAIMMSYPREQDKGKYFATFWMIFNLGATIGGVVPLAKEWNNDTSSVSIVTYIVFMVIMSLGGLLAIALLPPRKVHHDDGTPVSIHRFSNWQREAIEAFKLFGDWRMLCLIPLFGGSNWFYTYQFNCYNGGGYFNIRARALNNVLYWLFQIIGAGIFGNFLDWKAAGSRPKRAWLGLITTVVSVMAVWGAALSVQLKYDRARGTFLKQSGNSALQQDVTGGAYAGELIIYALFGAVDAIYQGYCYWLMGALTNDTEKASRFGAFYKTIQNAFAAVAGQVDAHKVEYITELGISWGLCVVGCIFAIPVVNSVADTTEEIVTNVDGADELKVIGGRVESESGVPDKNLV
ncbi:major facilitator superfamily domain-containing protein [Jimgerdemannia flammicorona]|uniref:Major facilitator superfamily domain-containing protein n=1 Tax=Jimgerdemannia flammicorona TaxID=994334 RepID=A0A433QDN1_9FUNG|nr:major facilitator superfamily domain-containing protein [Jimgerdemannia flammicorona]